MTKFSTEKILCGHFPRCSGCQIQTEVCRPPIWKEIEEFFHQQSIEILSHSREIIGWRTRAKLAVRGTKTQPQIGLFKRGTHEVVEILDCPLHTPPLNRALLFLREQVVRCGIEPYVEKQRKGLLRYVQLWEERSHKKVQLTLVVNADVASTELLNFVEELKKWDGWHSIWVNFQPEATNRILGDEWLHCFGKEYLWEKMGGVYVSFHPACFSQAHPTLFEEILQEIQRNVAPDKKIVEFYAGVGAIGLGLVEKCKTLICTEMTSFAAACFQESITFLGAQKKTSFHVLPATDGLFLLEDAEVLIVDPPRKGVDPQLLEAIARSETLEQIVYVSCGWLSFQKDCQRLLDAGWKIEKAVGYLLFPGTDHMETLTFFRR